MQTYNLSNGQVLKIKQDIDPQNPRTDWDNLGTMVCFHKRYTLGDKQDTLFPIKSSDYSGWDDMKKAIIRNYNIAVILPIYMYDHSGITINTTGFSCQFDSGQIGFIFITKEKVREEYSIKNVTKAWKEKITKYLIGEVETYNQYLTGDVYGFVLEDADGNETDSCWGFFGSDIKENGILDHLDEETRKLVEEKLG